MYGLLNSHHDDDDDEQLEFNGLISWLLEQVHLFATFVWLVNGPNVATTIKISNDLVAFSLSLSLLMPSPVNNHKFW